MHLIWLAKKKDVKSDLQGAVNMPGLFLYCFKKCGVVIEVVIPKSYNEY